MDNRSSNPLEIRNTWSGSNRSPNPPYHTTIVYTCLNMQTCEPGYVSAKIIQADLFEWLLVFSNLNFELVQYEFS